MLMLVRVIAALFCVAVAGTTTSAARADAALDECLQDQMCGRLMQTMDTPDRKEGLVKFFAMTTCLSEIDWGIAASSPRKMCRDIAERLDAEEKVKKEKAAAAATADAKARQEQEKKDRA